MASCPATSSGRTPFHSSEFTVARGRTPRGPPVSDLGEHVRDLLQQHRLRPPGRNEANTAFSASVATCAGVRSSAVATARYSPSSVAPKNGGSSVFSVTTTPASSICRTGCVSIDATCRVRTLDVGQTSSGIPLSTRCSINAGSSTQLVPWPIRSARRSRTADQTVSGPVVSPACGTLCRPASLAASKKGANWARPTPASVPPRPKETRPSGRSDSANASVSRPATRPF